MKRAGNLWARIVDRDNLRLAFSKAQRGKRSSPEVRLFAEDLEENLLAMGRSLHDGEFVVGRFHQFVIHDPKERIITAPCFPERVAHHALMNVCEGVFEHWLIDDTYACRVGRGRIAALSRAQGFAGRFPYFLKLDIRKYFDSVPHDELLARLERIFKDRPLLALLGRIVRTFRGPLGRGLPIGSLTSQHLANFYLGWCDRFVKERLRAKGYVRYMDDMALWGETSAELQSRLLSIRAFLRSELALELKPWPYINRCAAGMEFLGCRIYPRHMTLTRRGKRRFRRKVAALERQWLAGEITEQELQSRATALAAFTRTFGLSSWTFRKAVIQSMLVSGPMARTG